MILSDFTDGSKSLTSLLFFPDSRMRKVDQDKTSGHLSFEKGVDAGR